ncbi:hypothetical protein [Georgenia sp. AZ-5]|uniref:hypothetical protein n=1 Tax=Georgenia sp. AZ-5 TaxID=3367526 RepID=UPI0037544EC0
MQLEGSSLDELRRRVRAEHGPAARIVAAERIVEGGIGGFFARQRFEITVEVPDLPRPEPVVFDLPARAGIAALLAQAEGGDELAGSVAPVSTASAAFGRVLDDVIVATTAPGGSVPRPLAAAGDLVVLAGLGPDAVAVAEAMAGHVGATVAAAGSAAGAARAETRQEALAARAAGVRAGRAVVVAVGLAGAGEGWDVLRALAPDQVWAVVDAGRKADDTAEWVAALQEVAAVDAVAVVGLDLTRTPGTVNDLGLPVGWIGDAPARARTV